MTSNTAFSRLLTTWVWLFLPVPWISLILVSASLSASPSAALLPDACSVSNFLNSSSLVLR